MENNNDNNNCLACDLPAKPGSKYCCDEHKSQYHNNINKKEKAQKETHLIDLECKKAVLENDLRNKDKEFEALRKEYENLKEIIAGIVSSKVIAEKNEEALAQENAELKTKLGQLEEKIKWHETNYPVLVGHYEQLKAYIVNTQQQPSPINVPQGGQIPAAVPESEPAKKATMFGWFAEVW